MCGCGGNSGGGERVKITEERVWSTRNGDKLVCVNTGTIMGP